MARPPITAKSDRLFRKQIDAALDYVEANAGGGGGGSSAWADITGKPSTFTPSSHSHAISDTTGLTTALSGKAAATHSHAISDVTGLQTALDALGGDILELPVQSSTPSAAADILKVFSARRANRALLRMVGQSGIDVSLQPALFGNTIGMMMPSAGTGQSLIGLSMTALNSGTSAAQSTPGVQTTNDLTWLQRILFGTGTTATGASGIRTATVLYGRGNAAGRGGWFQFFRFGVEVFASDLRLILGMTNNTTALAAEPSTYSHMQGIIKDSTDTNWHFCTNGSDSVGTKVNTGVAVAAGVPLDFFSFCPPNGSEISFMLSNPMTGEILAQHTATTDLPGATNLMVARVGIQSQTGTTAKSLAVNRMYIETDL